MDKTKIEKRLSDILENEPTLTKWGFHIPEWGGVEKIEAGRDELRGALDEIKSVVDWIEANTIKTVEIDQRLTSYSWKHVCERDMKTYVANGVFIAAALIFECQYEMDGPNACFNLALRLRFRERGQLSGSIEHGYHR